MVGNWDFKVQGLLEQLLDVCSDTQEFRILDLLTLIKFPYPCTVFKAKQIHNYNFDNTTQKK